MTPPSQAGSQPMNANKALWEKGDFTRLAATMRDSGAAVIDELGVTEGMDVLDLGCGDGTTAIPAAERGANVLGVDIATNLVAAGKARAAAAGLENIRFEEGDASNLAGIDDDRFDLVVSMFGAMFAPRPHDVAREMVRVTRPGRADRDGQLDCRRSDAGAYPQDQRRFHPAATRGFRQPGDWEFEDHVRDRFGAAGVSDEDIRSSAPTPSAIAARSSCRCSVIITARR